MKTYYICRNREGRIKITPSSVEMCWDGLLSPVMVFINRRLWMELVFVVGVPMGTLITMMVDEVGKHSEHTHHNHGLIPWLYVIWFVVARIIAVIYTNKWINEKLSCLGYEVETTVQAVSVEDAYNAYASLKN